MTVSAATKKHDFGSIQKWQIWPNFSIEKTQLVHGISTGNKHYFKAHPLPFLVLKNFFAALQKCVVETSKRAG